MDIEIAPKGELLESEIYGVWVPEEGGTPARWFTLSTNEVFHTSHLAVAQAQCRYTHKHSHSGCEVRRMVAE